MLNIAVAGLGTVGAGVVRLLQANADVIAARAGTKIAVKAVSARDKNRRRACDLSAMEWVEDPRHLAAMPTIDVVVEVIGGASGVAFDLAEAALKNGKHYVTANKALLAAHGAALAGLAESHKAQLSFEAAVAGGIPVIKSLREGLAGNHVTLVRGILNGTCNYILTRMQEEGLDFDQALCAAQQQGFAEADPSADIDGHDSANKLAILAALAFGTAPDLASVAVEGIRRIVPLDLKFAAELDCRIKLLGVARESGDGIEQRVAPCLVPVASPLSRVGGALNAVLMQGDFVGEVTLEGAGAGAFPTASAVVADLIDIARGKPVPAFGRPAAALQRRKPASASLKARYYLRLQVEDQPGVVADVAAILRDEAISIEALLQRNTSMTHAVPVVITTHSSDAAAIKRAAGKIAGLPSIAAPPCVLRIED